MFARAPLSDRTALMILIAAYGVSATVMFGVTQIEVDIGRDFVAPDLMMQGRVLYRDIEYWFGPFAPSLHYLLFRAFGVSLEVVFGAGVAAGFAITLMAYWLAREILPPLEGLICGLIVLTHGAFGGSIMNHATPYTFSATYGLMFSLLAFLAVTRYLRAAEPRWGLLAGAAGALGLLCKQEFGLISIGLLGAGVLTSPQAGGLGLVRRAAPLLSGYFAIAGAASLVLFSYVTPAEFVANYYPAESIEALRYFYANAQGWGPRVPEFLVRTHGLFLLNIGFVVALAALIAMGFGILRGERPRLLVAAMVVASAAPLIWARGYLWCYPPLLPLAVIVFAWRSPGLAKRRIVVLFGGAALLFGWRVLPNFDIRYYAPMYFVPSVIVYVYLLFGVALPRMAARLPGRAWRGAMAAALIGPFVMYQFAQNNWRIVRESVPLKTERGTVHIPAERMPVTRALIQVIEEHSEPGDRILPIPGGAMYCFLTNRPPASRYLDYVYATLLDGEREEEEVRWLASHPPRLVFIAPHDNKAYLPGDGDGRFGAAYNRKVHDWIVRNYRDVEALPAALDGYRVMTPLAAR